MRTSLSVTARSGFRLALPRRNPVRFCPLSYWLSAGCRVVTSELCEELLLDILHLDLKFTVYLHLVGEQFQMAAEVDQGGPLAAQLELSAAHICERRLSPPPSLPVRSMTSSTVTSWMAAAWSRVSFDRSTCARSVPLDSDVVDHVGEADERELCENTLGRDRQLGCAPVH